MKNRITQMNNSINKFYSILDNWKGQKNYGMKHRDSKKKQKKQKHIPRKTLIICATGILNPKNKKGGNTDTIFEKN